MSQAKSVKPKRARLLLKRFPYVRNFPRTKSYKRLYQKLKHNNSSLARALSEEKQESQLLYSQIIALNVKVQELTLACNKRDTLIMSIRDGSKEVYAMLKILETYMSNIVTSCQEFDLSSNATVVSPRISARRESSRRLSSKSPARGVVKPMVSGHTITKPTINLSRVNMQRVNNPPSLSPIEEVSTPNRSQETSGNRSPNVLVTQSRNVASRPQRIPRGMTISSPRTDEEEERRSGRRSSQRSSRRMSGRYSKSKTGRLSGDMITRHSSGYAHDIGSPRVKLNDVSKLLQNSQSINVRTLFRNLNNQRNESSESSDEARENADPNVLIAETQASITFSEEDANKTADSKDKSEDENVTTIHRSTGRSENSTSNTIDPLEGTSWMFNESPNVPCSKRKHTDTVDSSSKAALNNTTDQETSPLAKSANRTRNSIRNRSLETEDPLEGPSWLLDQYNSSQERTNNGLCTVIQEPDTNETEKPTDQTELRYITCQRGCSYVEDDDDDFTLMISSKPQEMNFDINDLRLPVLERSVVNPTVENEAEPEVTTNLRRITGCPLPSITNNEMDETILGQTMLKLPEPTPMRNKKSFQKKTSRRNKTGFEEETPRRSRPSEILRQCRNRNVSFADVTNQIECTSPLEKRKKKQKSKSMKDPSSAKVVLQKLNESYVRQRRSSLEDSNSFRNVSFPSSRVTNSSDSESNGSESISGRPRRRKAPVNLREPSLHKKLRRDH